MARIVLSSFEPRHWLANRHIQTVCAALPGPGRPRATIEHWIVPLPGGVERLHAKCMWLRGRRPTVLVVHGVGGSSESAYVRRAASALLHAGWHTVCVDLRGAGLGAPLAQTLYHAGLIEDIDVMIEALHNRPEVGSVGLLGLSLGGQASLLAAARGGEDFAVKSVVTVSAPFDLDTGCTLLDNSRFYRRYILHGLVQRARRLARHAPHRLPVDLAELRSFRHVRTFDDRVIAPMHGFDSAQHYYGEVSCGPHLHAIQVPTLCVGSEDDPIVPYSTLAPYVPEASPQITMIFSRRGGHLGFVGGVNGNLGRSWAMDQAVAFLRWYF